MPVNIHGKTYYTVAERVEMIHRDQGNFSIQTEIISATEDRVVVKATIQTDKGLFNGTSSVSLKNPNKAIESGSPYEVAETSALGRALAFAGYAGTEIASANELEKALDGENEGTANQDKCPECGASSGTHSPVCSRNPKNQK